MKKYYQCPHCDFKNKMLDTSLVIKPVCSSSWNRNSITKRHPRLRKVILCKGCGRKFRIKYKYGYYKNN